MRSVASDGDSGAWVRVRLDLSACGGGKPARRYRAATAGGAGKVLNLYIWSDYLAPNTLSDFEKQTGIKVHVAYYDTNETLETKLLAGTSGYDIVVPRPPISSGRSRPASKN